MVCDGDLSDFGRSVLECMCKVSETHNKKYDLVHASVDKLVCMMDSVGIVVPSEIMRVRWECTV